MALTLITGPTQPVLTLAEMKAFLRVDDNDDDVLIAELVQAATSNLDGGDGWLGRALVTQTWDLYLDEFPEAEIRVPLPPLQSVDSVNYIDPDGAEQTVAAGNYTLDTATLPGWILPAVGFNWPATINAANAVRVRFVAGYAAGAGSPADLAANVPAPIKIAIRRIVATHYAHREDVVVGASVASIPRAVDALLAPYRVHFFPGAPSRAC